MKPIILKWLTLGDSSDLSEGKRLALKIAVLDGYWSLIVVSYYIYYSLNHHLGFFSSFYPTTFFLTAFGIWLISKNFYDAGRFLIHGLGLIQIFFSVDAFGINSGGEFYYFTSIAIPFATFASEEQWKGNILTLLSTIVLIVQQSIGDGIFLQQLPIEHIDKIVAITFVVCYFVLIFSVLRWQVKESHDLTTRKQKELLHSSNMITRGELTEIVVHEINNPLQSLSLRMAVIRDKLRENEIPSHAMLEHLNNMEKTVINIGKLVQGLADVVQAESQKPGETFHFGEILEDVLAVSTESLNANQAKLFINGDTSYHLKGHPLQIYQVLLTLINNSLEAMKENSEKWIRIKIVEKNSFLQVCVTDSRSGKMKDIAVDVGAYVTQEDLSHSRKIIEKNHGRLFHDPTDPNTRVVVLLPLK